MHFDDICLHAFSSLMQIAAWIYFATDGKSVNAVYLQLIYRPKRAKYIDIKNDASTNRAFGAEIHFNLRALLK